MADLQRLFVSKAVAEYDGGMEILRRRGSAGRSDRLFGRRPWKWNPPANDGRIRPDHAHIPVQWKAGFNTIRAEVAHTEFFGWGLAVRTGLSGSLEEDLSL
ncbi:hypothetical protein [Paenibacillus oleatilyticus]|uniref:Uncharacterized protein n=1 Tax=Paenibacillus oleatilyticus TaxID=2594886 RepID=A0ABV4USH4_9BACL